MLSCDTTHGKYIACYVMYKGSNNIKDVNKAINDVKRNKTIQAVDWSPADYKVTIHEQEMKNFPNKILSNPTRSACTLSSTTAIAEVLSMIDHKFDSLYAKGAFVHWYIGRLEEG